MRKINKKEARKAGTACGVGGAVGASTHATIGSVGLAATGTAVGVGLGWFIAAGAVLGLAGYGVYRLVTSKEAEHPHDDQGL